MTHSLKPRSPIHSGSQVANLSSSHRNDIIMPSVSRRGPCHFQRSAGVKARGIFLGKAL